MRLILALLSLVALSACVDPRLGAAVSIGPGGASVSPSVSVGAPGGGTLTYTP